MTPDLTIHGYGEMNDQYGLHAKWRPTTWITGLAATIQAAIQVYHDPVPGADDPGWYHFVAVAITNGNVHTVANAWLPNEYNEGYAETETEYETASECDALYSPVYFGADANGEHNSSTVIKKETSSQPVWAAISNSWTSFSADPHSLFYHEINGSRDTFDTYGGG